MSLIDYGVIVKVNGELRDELGSIFSNYDEIYDWVPEKYIYKHESYPLKGNYTSFVGEKDFFIGFYKEYLCVFTQNELLKSIQTKFTKEVAYVCNIPITIERLDKSYQVETYDDLFDVYSYAYMTQKERFKVAKRTARRHNVAWKSDRRKYVATWDYNGNHYEVVFGYGIDPDKEVYDDIKYDHYDYTEAERKFLENWYK